MKRKPAAKRAIKEAKLSRTHPPVDVSPADWQRALRRQFGRDQMFRLENRGDQPFFSEFRISNPQSKAGYRVAIRGLSAGDNYCSCPDYATNELGTCKHIEFVLARLGKKRGAKAAFTRGWRPAFSEIYLRNDGGRAVHFRAGSDCPPALLKAAARLFDASRGGLLPEGRFNELEHFLATSTGSGHELRAYDDALDFIAGRRDAARRAEILDRQFPRGASDRKLAQLLKAPLYPYQADGALFAVRAGRALIGDEMGLGKTIQAIAAMEILARHFGVSRVLVVCPTSLKYQWQNEISRFSGRAARVMAGGWAQRQQDFRADEFCKITNYEKLKPDLDLIAEWAPELVIVDEAQRIKNWNTIAARALKRIDSPYALVLTGTPLENKLEELISIVQFVDQHRLGPTWKLLYEHQAKDETGRVTGYTGLQKIGQTLAPILIRRRRSEVLTQLPSRTDQNLLVPMTEMQLVHHQENADIVAKIVARWRRMKFLSDKDQRRLTCALQNMRMSCNSTWLLDRETDHGVKADELAALLDGVFVQPDAKAVVFSQWVATHELIARRLKKKRWDYALFHGGVPGNQRGALVERFHKDPDCRVFLSTDAGGVGLNLQHAASTIVNMDMPWNPAVLEQRIGRVHRLGQSRSVQVINFVAEDSIEERMLSLLAFKKSLFAGVLDGGGSEVFLGGSRLAKFMEGVDAVTGEVAETAPESAATPVSKAAGRKKPAAEPSPITPEPTVTPANPWSPLLHAGLKLMEALAAPPPGHGGHSVHDYKNGNGKTPAAAHSSWVETDANTGRSYLKLPVPEPQVIQQLSDALSRLVAGLGR